MPSISLAVFVIAIVARYVRSEMLEVLGQDYVTLAKSKGLSWHGRGLEARVAQLAHTARHGAVPAHGGA